MPSRLQKWQTNQIFKAIQAVGLDPKGFDLENNDAEVSIKHKWSVSYFSIVPDPSHYVGRRVGGHGMDWPVTNIAGNLSLHALAHGSKTLSEQ